MLAAAVSSAARSSGESAASRAAISAAGHGVVLGELHAVEPRRLGAHGGVAAGAHVVHDGRGGLPHLGGRRRQRPQARHRRGHVVVPGQLPHLSSSDGPQAVHERVDLVAEQDSGGARRHEARAAGGDHLPLLQLRHPRASGGEARAQLDHPVGEAERRAPAPARRPSTISGCAPAAAKWRRAVSGCRVAILSRRSGLSAAAATANTRSSRQQRRSSRSATPWRPSSSPSLPTTPASSASRSQARRTSAAEPRNHAPAACRSSAGACLPAQRGGRQAGRLQQVEDLGRRRAGLTGEADPHPAPSASAISRAPPVTSRPSARRSV